jgi:hypothetical protein
MEKTIVEIEKGEDLVRVMLRDFKGKQYVDARVYYMNDTGEWLPTKKGLSMAPDMAKKIADAIVQALDEVARGGKS